MWGLLPVLSVCLSAFALAWWLVCGWLAILPLACDLRTTLVSEGPLSVISAST